MKLASTDYNISLGAVAKNELHTFSVTKPQPFTNGSAKYYVQKQCNCPSCTTPHTVIAIALTPEEVGDPRFEKALWELNCECTMQDMVDRVGRMFMITPKESKKPSVLEELINGGAGALSEAKSNAVIITPNEVETLLYILDMYFRGETPLGEAIHKAYNGE